MKHQKIQEVIIRIREISKGIFPLLGFLLITFPLVGYWYFYYAKENKQEYSGIIVDKRISSIETNEGTKFSYNFLIENKNGENFEFSTSEIIYRKSKIGDSIVKKEDEVIVLPN
jgi:hypothetical protein